MKRPSLLLTGCLVLGSTPWTGSVAGQLSPASVEARFQWLQWRRRWNPDADDPLFRPIDADDFRTNGEAASDVGNLRQNGLVSITLALPPTIRLIDPVTNAVADETTVDVWRMVPTVNDVALTGPDAGASVWPREPSPTGGCRFSTISSQCPRPVDTVAPARFAFAPCPPRLARNARTCEIVRSLATQGPTGIIPAGATVRRTSSDPGRALQSGFVGGPGPFDDWDTFDVPGLRGLRATATSVHNNSAATLEGTL